MKKFGIKAKIWAGYGVLACVLMVSTWMTYDNSRSLVAVNEASNQMMHRRYVVDSLVCAMLETSNAERAVLLGNAEAWPHFDRSLSEVMTKAQQLRHLLSAGNQRQRVDTLLAYMQQKRDNTLKVIELLGADHRDAYYRSRVEALQDGRDSVVIHPKTTGNVLRHETVYEVERSKRGFFRRLGDAFRRQHADTVGITTIAHQAQADSMQQAIDIADSVAHVLADIQQAEKQASNRRQDAVTNRYRRLQQVSLVVANRTGLLLRDIQNSEQRALRKAIDQSITSRQGTILRIVLLALMAIGSAAILLTYILRDVRRDRLHRQRLVEAKAETEKLMQQRERLLLTITHDIKAPAASIAGFISLLQPYVQGAKATGYLTNIGTSATHLQRLVSALLDYHLLESGKAELHNISFVPLRLANEVVGEMRPMAQSKGLTLRTDADEGAQRMCKADAFRVKQILNNLVGNALKYTDEGGVTITLRLVAGWLTLAVTDTGRGMTSDEQHRVFDAFTRLPGAQGIEGIGLGLSITRETVQLLGGTIHVTSTVGQGSTFTVRLPMKVATSAAATSEILSPAPSSPTLAQQSLTILVIDDDGLQLQLLGEMLSQLGGTTIKVLTTQHVTEALENIATHHPDVLFTDIEMPEMSGTDLIRHIDHSHMKVVAMTAHDDSMVPRLRQAGFDACLLKPFSINTLAATLTQVTRLPFVPKTMTPESQADDTPDLFAPLTAFAEGDAEAERDILTQTAKAIDEYLALLTPPASNDALSVSNEYSSASNDFPSPETEAAYINKVGKAAHKALPLLTMLMPEEHDVFMPITPQNIALTDPDERQCLAQQLSAVLNRIKQLLQDKLNINKPLCN